MTIMEYIQRDGFFMFSPDRWNDFGVEYNLLLSQGVIEPAGTDGNLPYCMVEKENPRQVKYVEVGHGMSAPRPTKLYVGNGYLTGKEN